MQHSAVVLFVGWDILDEKNVGLRRYVELDLTYTAQEDKAKDYTTHFEPHIRIDYPSQNGNEVMYVLSWLWLLDVFRLCPLPLAWGWAWPRALFEFACL